MVQHINGNGDPGTCRAKPGNCPFGGENDHYKDKAEARRIYEEQQELLSGIGTGPKHPLSAAAERVLTGSLEPLEDQPEWIWEHSFRLQQELFGVTPQSIAVVDSPLGRLALVWEEESIDGGDIHSYVDRGYRVSRIALRSLADGELYGHLKTAQRTRESLEASYGSDEWRGMRYLRSERSFYAMASSTVKHYEISPDQGADDLQWESRSIEPPKLETDSQLQDFIQRARVTLYAYDRDPVRSMSREALKDELEELKAMANLELDRQSNDSTVHIDQSRIYREELRGQGLGAALYIAMGRKQAERGNRMMASGLQTEEAKRSWQRMASDPRLPVAVQNDVYWDSQANREIAARYVLDFRDAEQKKI